MIGATMKKFDNNLAKLCDSFTVNILVCEWCSDIMYGIDYRISYLFCASIDVFLIFILKLMLRWGFLKIVEFKHKPIKKSV